MNLRHFFKTSSLAAVAVASTPIAALAAKPKTPGEAIESLVANWRDHPELANRHPEHCGDRKKLIKIIMDDFQKYEPETIVEDLIKLEVRRYCQSQLT